MNKFEILINPEIFNSDEARIVLSFIIELSDIISNVNFIWNEEFYKVFFSNDYEKAQNLYKNNYSLMYKLFKNFCNKEESNNEAICKPDIMFINDSIRIVFLKVVHNFIEKSITELPFIYKNIEYKFFNESNSKELSTVSTLSIQDYIKYVKSDLYDLFWPNKKEDFSSCFSYLIQIKEKELGYALADRKYNQIQFSSRFISDACKFPKTYREKSLEMIVQRLHKSQNAASRSSLNDEPILNSNNRRFYITRDNGRVHYNYPREKCIQFIRLSLDHDMGL